jgi:hypothetical protein
MELGFGSSLLVRFQVGRCPEIDNAVTAALCRPIETSSDIDDNKRARHRRPCRQRNGTKPKFFNDFSRARACARAQGSVGSRPPVLGFTKCTCLRARQVTGS